MSTDLEQALVSYRDDVRAITNELAEATDVSRFGDALAELLEVASDCNVLVSRTRDGRLAIGELLITVELAPPLMAAPQS